MTIALVAAALAVLLWPAAKRPSPILFPAATVPAPPGPPAPPAAATYAHAIHALAFVRGRLSATDHLGDAERAAIDAITLALVAGSDAP